MTVSVHTIGKVEGEGRSVVLTSGERESSVRVQGPDFSPVDKFLIEQDAKRAVRKF